MAAVYSVSRGYARMRILVVFEKADTLKYIGHLDLMRALQRAFRRSGLPVAYSMGFNPHMLVTFASALSVGTVGLREIMDVKLSESCDMAEFTSALTRAVPPGITVKETITIGDNHPAPMAQLYAASYDVKVLLSQNEPMHAAIAAINDAPSILIDRKTKKGLKKIDIKPFILSLNASYAEDAACIHMCLAHREGAACKPDEIVTELRRLNGLPQDCSCKITRTALWGLDGKNELAALERI